MHKLKRARRKILVPKDFVAKGSHLKLDPMADTPKAVRMSSAKAVIPCLEMGRNFNGISLQKASRSSLDMTHFGSLLTD
ncbi:hypothetical protein Tco_0175171 [Tanacetum coccineum]